MKAGILPYIGCKYIQIETIFAKIALREVWYMLSDHTLALVVLITGASVKRGIVNWRLSYFWFSR